MAKDPKPANGRPSGGASRGGASSAGRGSRAGGRTRPPVDVVNQPRPWGLIAAAVAVAVFAAAAIGYAVVQVNTANADRITSADQLEGLQTFDYSAGQEHLTTPVDYAESPPVGGPHAPPPDWADCTGTVYDVGIRHENAVHSLEHGAVWITYDPAALSEDEIDTLADLVEDQTGRMMSPLEGQDSPISLQSWGHQLTVDSVDDVRIKQFADFLTQNSEFTPEPGASCENPTFAADPVLEEPASADDGAPTTETPAETPAP